MSDKPTGLFRRNELLEALLKELNDELAPAEELLLNRYRQTQEIQHPIILVMGPLRSGTTLFVQWLANTGLIAYPSNLLSRFYRVPIIGAKIQLLLTDPRYNFRDELGEFVQQSEYKSENGKTRGVLAPNEFWYFWRRFLAEPDRDIWTDDELRQSMDAGALVSELAGITSVFQKPFAAKGMLFNYNIPFLNSILDKVIFVQIHRDPVSNVSAALEARERQMESLNRWYSFKIPEYESLKDLDPVRQVAGQIHYINKAVVDGLARVDESRKILVEYESFCGDPAAVYEQLMAKLGMNLSLNQYNGPAGFTETRAVTGSAAAVIKSALASFAD